MLPISTGENLSGIILKTFHFLTLTPHTMTRFILLLLTLAFAIYSKYQLREQSQIKSQNQYYASYAEAHFQRLIQEMQTETLDCHIASLQSGDLIHLSVSECTYEVFQKYKSTDQLSALVSDFSNKDLYMSR